MVLTDEKQQDIYPVATLEDAVVSSEQNYYSINTGAITANPASLTTTYPNNNGIYNPGPNPTAPSQRMYRLNGATGDKTGLGITLRVMAGDTVNILGKSYWTGSSPNNTYTTVVNDLLTALAATSAVAGAGKGATAAGLTGSTVTPGEVSSFLSTAPLVTGRPKAYINWILFDEQFRPVSASSGFSAVSSTSGLLNTHTQNVGIVKNGYLYVYCSNESNIDVFFDNLQLIQNRGALLEETHYYPAGLTMAGISSKAAGKPENKYKYNGIELDEDLGLNAYEAHFRTLDLATGRWWQIDPKIDGQEMWSPYNAMTDNPVLKADPLGDTSILSNIGNNVKQGWNDFNNGRGTAYKAVDWFNRNLNLLTDVYHAVAGKDFVTGEKTSRSEALMEIGLVAVGAKAEMAVAKTIERSIIAETVGTVGKSAAKGGGKYLYHYTSREAADNILKTGLTVTEKRPFIYTTNIGNLSSLQAQIELALPANRALPNTILRIDASGLNPFMIRRVQGNLPGLGAGGGTEFMFNQNIPANLIKIVK